MEYTIAILDKHRRDLIATANAVELEMSNMLDPNTEATIDRVRKLRMRSEELGRAIAVLRKSNVLGMG